MKILNSGFVLVMYIIVSLSLFNCQNKKSITNIDKDTLFNIFQENYLLPYNYKAILDDRIGKQIFFADSVTAIKDGNVLSTEICSILDNSRPKIIGIIPGDCHVCIHKINEWNNLIKSKKFQNTQFIFIISTTNVEMFLKVFYPSISYDGILILDEKDWFYTKNNITKEPIEFNTFLIDKNLTVKITGDPLIFNLLIDLYDKKTMELFIEDSKS